MSELVRGRIIRAIAGFYYVYTPGDCVYECHAKGVFRNRNEKPLVGDEVSIQIIDQTKLIGNIEKLHERHSSLIRPSVANADAALIVMSLTNPDANLNLLDRFLIQMEWQDMPCIICFNKIDIADRDMAQKYKSIYENVPYTTLSISAATGEGLDELKELLQDKVTVIAGQSGAGKSTLVNALQSDVVMETGEISKKLGRGRHTTRRSELIPLNDSSFIVDTPGFSSIDMRDITEEEMQDYFPEIRAHLGKCFYTGCAHINEPKCSVKDALLQGEIDNGRYTSYGLLYEECKNRKKY